MTVLSRLRRWRSTCFESTTVFLRDVGHGLLEICHNSLALLGLCVVAALLFAGTRADLRHSIEQHALDWLLERQEARTPASDDVLAEMAEPSAIERATAVDPRELPRQQAAVAQWLARRYKVAPEPLSRLVQEAWSVGHRMGVDPTLVLAVMAIESSFNPFAQSPVGAQGLMQVMTRIHDDKYQAFGGARAAFDPVTNLRVGVQVLKECIARAGGLEAGLRYYVGAAIHGQDGGYVVKVLAEQTHLQLVANGKPVSINAPLPVFRPLSPSEANTPQALPEAPAMPASAPPTAVEDERVALLR
ncbi:lytic transglycosylase domain-containing protein [Ideonella sp. A 288]|uniref:lytic transglycosylase domain-containing protein n=1 Tax=Ideonella sp. A 288 TaxID=1962181 RepID=UPI000B4BE07A|nr:lytic transglycosylase domain-containing protein [Ideonella sp. A 288]